MRSSLPLILVMLAACSSSVEGDDTNELLDAYSSSEAVLLDFEFDGEVATASTWDAESTINDQLLYTIGHLNADNSVGRLDNLELPNIVKTQDAGKTVMLGFTHPNYGHLAVLVPETRAELAKDLG